jgi:hypothetical protein
MTAKLTRRLERVDVRTRVQYGLMVLFGTLCLLAAVAPLEQLVKVAVVATLFGITTGLWVSHLVEVVQRTAERNRTGTTR